MAKLVKVETFKALEDALQMWLTQEEREITSSNIYLIGEMVAEVDKIVTSPEVKKALAGIIGRLVSVEKQLDGLNDILMLN